MANLPLTTGRIQSSVVLRASKFGNVNFGTGLGNLLATGGGSLNPADFLKVAAIALEMGPIVGEGVLSFSRDQTRSNKRIYSLGRGAFEPALIVPGPIVTDIVIERMVLYENDFMEALGYATGNLFYQQLPFSVQEIMLVPDDSPSSKLDRANFYLNCWLENNPIDYDVDDDDQIVFQRMKLNVGSVISTTAAPFGLMNKLLKTENKMLLGKGAAKKLH